MGHQRRVRHTSVNLITCLQAISGRLIASLEHSAGDQGHILHVKFPSWETWAMPTRNLGVFEQTYSSPATQHARKSNISFLARRDVAKKLVKNVVFQEVISG